MSMLPVFNLTADAPNDHWTRQYHREGMYASYNPQPDYFHRDMFATDGAETDTDMIPYCDWMYDAGESPQATYAKVMGFTTSSCLDMDYVSCDFAGNVVEMRLSGRGLAGPLPSSFSSLGMLERLEMSFNKLNGTLPQSVWSSPYLEHLYITKNNFTGTIPCPSATEPKFKSLNIGKNGFTGDLPTCIFTSLPRLQGLDISCARAAARFPPAKLRRACARRS